VKCQESSHLQVGEYVKQTTKAEEPKSFGNYPPYRQNNPQIWRF